MSTGKGICSAIAAIESSDQRSSTKWLQGRVLDSSGRDPSAHTLSRRDSSCKRSYESTTGQVSASILENDKRMSFIMLAFEELVRLK